MSIRENIELFYPLDLEKYLETLRGEYGAQPHPAQPNAYIVEDLPFYVPRNVGDHISILGFNKIPLPYSAIQVLVNHPELVSDDVIVRWTQEQDLILECTLGQLREWKNNNQEIK